MRSAGALEFSGLLSLDRGPSRASLAPLRIRKRANLVLARLRRINIEADAMEASHRTRTTSAGMMIRGGLDQRMAANCP